MNASHGAPPFDSPAAAAGGGVLVVEAARVLAEAAADVAPPVVAVCSSGYARHSSPGCWPGVVALSATAVGTANAATTQAMTQVAPADRHVTTTTRPGRIAARSHGHRRAENGRASARQRTPVGSRL
jgi:hypothetical protein